MKSTMMLVGFFLLGCVAHIPIEEQSPDLKYFSDDRIVVSVVDKRWRVQQGKPPTGIGVVRNIGIPTVAHTYPWYVDKTHKGQPLAQALEDRIVYGLNDEGWNTMAAGFASLPGPNEINGSLSQHQAEKLLILILKDWWCDININLVSAFRFDWDATVEIYDRRGNLIRSFSDAGRDLIKEEGSDSWPNMIRRAYRARLIKFLEKPEVIKSMGIGQ